MQTCQQKTLQPGRETERKFIKKKVVRPPFGYGNLIKKFLRSTDSNGNSNSKAPATAAK